MTIVTADMSALGPLASGSHVCWVVDDTSSYVDDAAALLAGGCTTGHKPVAFGPEGSAALSQLADLAALVADPRVEFLDGKPLDPDAMFSMFRHQTALARAEGYVGLRVVADMDWVLPGSPTVADIVAFELLLDRLVGELDATVICAYRRSSFDTNAIAGALAVHPIDVGADEEPQFRFVASGIDAWHLSGEVDMAVATAFEAAMKAAATGRAACVVDVTDLDFIDVAGMRAIARAGADPDRLVRLCGTPAKLRRAWESAGFDEVSKVELAV